MRQAYTCTATTDTSATTDTPATNTVAGSLQQR
jgi:hypothetical protein